MQTRLMSFNLRYANDEDPYPWSKREKAICQVIQHHAPDVLGTQEMTPEMLEALKEALPDYHSFGAHRREGDEANTVFIRKQAWELEKEDTFWLSQSPEKPGSLDWGSLPRICTWAVLRSVTNPSARIRIMNTHLDHESPYARQQGALIIKQHLEEFEADETLPTFILGDMNEGPNGEAINILGSCKTEAGAVEHVHDQLPALEPTFHNFKEVEEGEPIDYIFFSPDISIERVLIVRDRPDLVFPSDHDPVFIEATLK
ncbi:endonuclease/exonuclease/phosphatase family protein [Aureibacillus halotolerans]|uniref:Endonuclease/exonuclease/phosphatase family metal-dependent hydrolase n=1 Tax=Aureibacillus halotolerans TaxID=1508390 RepID=A0A4R6TYC2_9BACI|nr:endonuclease/exonuclease/phosphatase family protein [Aureibacillus halotolerans]TDQ37393.1 endonuclease/exonuclease/phosphatase family metal-dependent hydrolase [Aureibacillus halotolerans]